MLQNTAAPQGAWAVGLFQHIATLHSKGHWGVGLNTVLHYRGQWAVSLLQSTTAQHGAVNIESPIVHYRMGL